MHMIRKGQLDCPSGQTMVAVNLFYSVDVQAHSAVMQRYLINSNPASAVQNPVAKFRNLFVTFCRRQPRECLRVTDLHFRGKKTCIKP